ncbi:MAG: hypothetical protein LBH31_05795, partial [Burkholderiaceae bacterium]|jgi:hypothetical protein|nr:hypothetical protein [Burkholderiaceae bacterium]
MVSAYTNGPATTDDYSGQVLQTNGLATAAGLVPGNFYMASVDYGAIDCSASEPSPSDSPSPEISVGFMGQSGPTMTICADGANGVAKSVFDSASKGGTTDPDAYAETIYSPVVQYESGASAAAEIDIESHNPIGDGNDGGYNNLTLWNVTPTVSESVSATPPAGMTPTPTATTSQYLTYTITNTTDDLAKNGWSFTDQLPAGLTVVGKPGGTCLTSPPYAATVQTPSTDPPSSGNSIAVTNGNLPAGTPPGWTSPTWQTQLPETTTPITPTPGPTTSCTITVQVTASPTNTTTYTAGDANNTTLTSTDDVFTPFGLAPKPPVTLRFGPRMGGNGGPTSVPVSKGALGLLALLLAAAAYPLSRRAKKRC